MLVILGLLLFLFWLATVAAIAKPEIFARAQQPVPSRMKLVSALLFLSLLILFMMSALAPSAISSTDRIIVPDTSTPAPVAPPRPDVFAKHGQALPFVVLRASVSNYFKDNIQLAQIQVSVSGGDVGDWAATAITIAEKAIEMGSNSAKITVLRSDMEGVDVEQRYREYAVAYFNPNLQRAIWPEKQWDIFVAEHVVTPREIALAAEFQSLNAKLLARGMDVEIADKKAADQIAKKFKLAPDWQLPLGNLGGKPFPRSAFVIDDVASAATSLDKLQACVGGKSNIMDATCE